jgi:alpha,alpha-trehalase
MLFYVLSADELSELYDRLGYKFDKESILRNIEYYAKRTANTSTLSRVALTWVLSRMDRTNAWSLLSGVSHQNVAAPVPIPQNKSGGDNAVDASAKAAENNDNSYPDSWSIFREALGSDYLDIQGGTTPEGVHIGAMAGTVDIVQRCYTGIVTRNDVLWLNPCLPREMVRLAFHFQYRNQVIRLDITRKTATICVGHSSAKPIKVGFEKEVYELHAGDKKIFKLELEEND